MSRKGKLVRSPSDKIQYIAYALEMRHEKNKLARVERTKNNQPNNAQLAEVSRAYTRNRKSAGHICKGANTSLGFDKNNPTQLMLKGKAEVHLYHAGNTVFKTNTTVPNHGQSMCQQLEALGYKKKKYVKRNKKTAR